MKKGVKIAFWILVIMGLAAGFIYNYSKGIKVNTYTVKKRNYSQSFKESGEVTADQTNTVYALTNGKIILVNVKEGDKIKKGSLIGKIDTKGLDYQIRQLQAQIKSLDAQKLQTDIKPYEAQIEGFNLQIENLKRQLEDANKELERVKELYDHEIVSEIEYEKAQQNIENIENMILQQQNNIEVLKEQNQPTKGTDEYYEAMKESVRAQIQSLNYEKSRGNIYASMSGIVKSVNVKTGTVITAGTPVVEIFSPEKYKVETYVLTKDIHNINVGTNVECILKTREKDLVFKGSVEKISSTAVDKVSSLGLEEQRIKLTINPEFKDVTVRSGYNLDIKFTTYKKDNSIFITKSSIFPYKDGKAVWVVRESKAYIQPVKIGVEDNKDVIIESGLKEGDTVILDYNIKGLKEGKKVY
ncbi:efflux RND transporter periplasmic adaptor subunit [Clostridium ganghwense]|uniref:Efflux RND transporter periplasmic adaptor subunit n=1 Tax=Clostridium ganghwense TaxID=312089 RepID=A0ABT4CN63_9CLOT|nr:efflux RND transporter periplasmic adaptor subunit [Clostridium ganghwense]MCY6369434.1 efflux RND transporter periplasmic adaptor subunit [Clostridium ganghwense]